MKIEQPWHRHRRGCARASHARAAPTMERSLKLFAINAPTDLLGILWNLLICMSVDEIELVKKTNAVVISKMCEVSKMLG